MLLKLAIPLYATCLGGATLIKIIITQRNIGKNPVTLLTTQSLTEAYLKKLALFFFPLWLGGFHFFSFFPEWHQKTPHLTSSETMSYTGVIILFLSLILFVSSLINLKNSWRIGIDKNTTDQLITSGIYKIIRHPIYTSFKMALIATLLIFPNIYFLLIGALAFLGFTFIALLEEDFLRKHFGKTYESYLKKTGRFYPRLYKIFLGLFISR